MTHTNELHPLVANDYEQARRMAIGAEIGRLLCANLEISVDDISIDIHVHMNSPHDDAANERYRDRIAVFAERYGLQVQRKPDASSSGAPYTVTSWRPDVPGTKRSTVHVFGPAAARSGV